MMAFEADGFGPAMASGGRASPRAELASLDAVAAYPHRTPLTRAVTRGVEEQPAAVRARAGLHAAPGAVGHRLGDHAEHEPQRRVRPLAGRLVARRGVEAHVQRRR